MGEYSRAPSLNQTGYLLLNERNIFQLAYSSLSSQPWIVFVSFQAKKEDMSNMFPHEENIR